MIRLTALLLLLSSPVLADSGVKNTCLVTVIEIDGKGVMKELIKKRSKVFKESDISTDNDRFFNDEITLDIPPKLEVVCNLSPTLQGNKNTKHGLVTTYTVSIFCHNQHIPSILYSVQATTFRANDLPDVLGKGSLTIYSSRNLKDEKYLHSYKLNLNLHCD